MAAALTRRRRVVALGLAAWLALPAPLPAQEPPYVDPMTPAGRASLMRLGERARGGGLGPDVSDAVVTPTYWYPGAMHIELERRDGRRFGYLLLSAPRPTATDRGRRRDFGLFPENSLGVPYIARLSAVLDGLFVVSPWAGPAPPTLGVVSRSRAYLAVYFVLATTLPGLLYLVLARPRPGGPSDRRDGG